MKKDEFQAMLDKVNNLVKRNQELEVGKHTLYVKLHEEKHRADRAEGHLADIAETLGLPTPPRQRIKIGDIAHVEAEVDDARKEGEAANAIGDRLDSILADAIMGKRFRVVFDAHTEALILQESAGWEVSCEKIIRYYVQRGIDAEKRERATEEFLEQVEGGHP